MYEMNPSATNKVGFILMQKPRLNVSNRPFYFALVVTAIQKMKGKIHNFVSVVNGVMKRKTQLNTMLRVASYK